MSLIADRLQAYAGLDPEIVRALGADRLSIDQRLESFARSLDAEAELTRAMIGRLQVPSYAEWEAAQGEMTPF